MKFINRDKPEENHDATVTAESVNRNFKSLYETTWTSDKSLAAPTADQGRLLKVSPVHEIGEIKKVWALVPQNEIPPPGQWVNCRPSTTERSSRPSSGLRKEGRACASPAAPSETVPWCGLFLAF